MKYRNSILGLIVIIATCLMACDAKPKVVEQVQSNPPAQSANVQGNNVNVDPSTQTHEVVVQEILEAERYTYMNVSEDGNVYWMAVPKQEIEVGATYYYTGGLKKANFESKEHNRVFETLYLVMQVSRTPSDSGGSALAKAKARMDMGDEPEQDTKVQQAEGGITLKTLFEKPEAYAGKTVTVKGRCVKLNMNIMGTNWVHIQDGSDPNKELDLTITTMEQVSVGSVVEFEGKITLDKDFGAGYRYDIIMEDAHVH